MSWRLPGMTGSRLEVNVHVVTGSASSTQNVVACVNRAGVAVLDTVLEQLAATLPDQKAKPHSRDEDGDRGIFGFVPAELRADQHAADGRTTPRSWLSFGHRYLPQPGAGDSLPLRPDCPGFALGI